MVVRGVAVNIGRAEMMFLPESPLPLGPAGKELTSAMIRRRLQGLIDLTVESQSPGTLILELRYLADVLEAAREFSTRRVVE